MPVEKGEYIVFVDESGDHGLQNIDADYPIFVLSFCCFRISDYVNQAVPKIQEFKFKHFGHDQVILHEHHIRKQKGDYGFLRTSKALRTQFLTDIATLVKEASFEIVSVLIDKSKLTEQYKNPFNPYHLGLRFGLERLLQFLLENDQQGKETHIIFEKRGKKEDE
ncbi:MAG: DUF3800 domain-containing protein, partial [Candidatus Paceibacterota bacterium]